MPSRGSVSAVVALLVATFAAGFVLAMMLTPVPMRLDPVSAFCRGWTSGNAGAFIRMGSLTLDGYQLAKAGIEFGCLEKMQADPVGALTFNGILLDGPIGLNP